MIHRIYRLTAPKRIEIFQRELLLDNDSVVITPEYLSICAADLRYFFGRRSKEVMRRKLPMALIHEAVATVSYDPAGIYQPGQWVVPIPNLPGTDMPAVKGNYRPSSRFCSSGEDGFLQDLIAFPRERLLPVTPSESPSVYALLELLSVAFNALSSLRRPPRAACICGNGNVGFAVALALKYSYPSVPIYIAGTNPHKLQYFSFADATFSLDEIPDDVCFDVAFECVGGSSAEEVIEKMVELLEPQGLLSLLGVSEGRVPLNTRKILEKGLTLIGNSRSEREDFEKASALLNHFPNAQAYLYSIISQIIEVTDLRSLHSAFEHAETGDFKTLIHWRI